MTINERIKKRRIELDMTLEEVAKVVKTTRQTIQRYESGVISNIPSNNIEALAVALNTTPAYLMGWDEETPAIKPVEHKLTDNEKIFLEEINDLTEEEQQKVLDFIHFTKSQRTKRINLSPGTELAAFGGDFVSKPKKKKPEIL